MNLNINQRILKFSRITSGQKFVPEIDGLRFFAIITVLIFHLNTAFSEAIGTEGARGEGVEGPWNLGWWIIRMDLGVKVFFAISGFILALPFIKQYWFAGKKVQIKAYLIRRLTRLEPPYIIALTLFFGVHVFVLNVPFEDYLPNFLASLVYVHNFIFDRSSVILPVAWSLEVEVQFYLLIPILALLMFKPKLKWLGALFALLLLLATIFTKNYIMTEKVAYIGSSILVYFSHFAVGILFAMLFLVREKLFVSKQFLWDVVGAAALFLLFFFYKPQSSILNNIVFNAAIFAMFIAVFKGRLTNLFFTQPFVFVVGGMCYTIYLIHFPMLMLLVKGTKHLAIFEGYYPNLAIQFLVLFPVVLAGSAIFFKLFEQPFMDKLWPEKLRASMKQRFGK